MNGLKSRGKPARFPRFGKPIQRSIFNSSCFCFGLNLFDEVNFHLFHIIRFESQLPFKIVTGRFLNAELVLEHVLPKLFFTHKCSGRGERPGILTWPIFEQAQHTCKIRHRLLYFKRLVMLLCSRISSINMPEEKT